MTDKDDPGVDVWLLAVHPALTRDLVAWLARRGLKLGRIPSQDEPVWTTTPTDELTWTQDTP